jgi:hypothetical protein
MPVPAAQRQTTDARLRHPAQRGGEPEGLRLPVYITQHSATLHAGQPPLGINFHATHSGQINEHTVTDGRQPSHRMTTAAYRDQ